MRGPHFLHLHYTHWSSDDYLKRGGVLNLLQKLIKKNPTGIELVSVEDMILKILWTRYLLWKK